MLSAWTKLLEYAEILFAAYRSQTAALLFVAFVLGPAAASKLQWAAYLTGPPSEPAANAPRRGSDLVAPSPPTPRRDGIIVRELRWEVWGFGLALVLTCVFVILGLFWYWVAASNAPPKRSKSRPAAAQSVAHSHKIH